jgi:glucose 1-dehydrogenase
MSIRKLLDLTGRRALVTGASRGIGRSIALGLAEFGADVCVHFAGNAESAENVAEECRAFGVGAGTTGVDLALADAPSKLMAGAAGVLGASPDIVVLNASVQHRHDWPGVTRDEFEQQMAVNFRSCFETIQLALPSMIERKWGRIVTIGSVQQTVPAASMPIYAATKSALLNLVRNLAREVAKHRVTINNLAPGVIATDRNAEVLADPQKQAKVLARIPAGRTGEPIDCVGTCILMCGDAASYMTGADVYVDGGWSLP